MFAVLSNYSVQNLIEHTTDIYTIAIIAGRSSVVTSYMHKRSRLAHNPRQDGFVNYSIYQNLKSEDIILVAKMFVSL